MHLNQAIESASALQAVAWGQVYFASIYGVLATAVFGWAHWVGRPLETRPPTARQIRQEIRHSLQSVAVFGVGALVPWGLLQWGWARLAPASAWELLMQCAALVLWNEVHFYVAHRWLHGGLRKAHVEHHRSVAATPFAAYRMSVVEALLLGSVLPLAMLVYPFCSGALLFLTVWSLCVNTMAHSNADLLWWLPRWINKGFIAHHQQHHSHYHGNFGFFFPHLDRWLKTQSPAPHANAQAIQPASPPSPRSPPP